MRQTASVYLKCPFSVAGNHNEPQTDADKFLHYRLADQWFLLPEHMRGIAKPITAGRVKLPFYFLLWRLANKSQEQIVQFSIKNRFNCKKTKNKKRKNKIEIFQYMYKQKVSNK